MIDLDEVSVHMGDTSILMDVSLSVDRGRFVGLVGPNGAGKTTLLRAVNGRITPDTGTVRVDDTDVGSLSSRAASQLVATVPQETTLGFDFPVRDVVAMGRTAHRGRFSTATSRDLAAIDRAMERTEVVSLADRSVGTLSGGERQRVLLARALAQDTPVLLLDEPTSSLDIGHEARLLDLVSELVQDGRTVVAAVHDLDLAARYCDQVALLSDGSLVAAGETETVLTADRLGEVFETTVSVTAHPATGEPSVTVGLPDS